MFNSLFTTAIFILVFVLIISIIRTVFQILTEKNKQSDIYSSLETHLTTERFKLEKNNEKIKLLNQLHETLFNSFFAITKDIILLQKFIFENYSK